VFYGVNSGHLVKSLKITGEFLRLWACMHNGVLMSSVKLMIDAEHTWYQPALDAFTLLLSEEFNKPQKGDTNWKGPLILFVPRRLPCH